MVVAVDQLSKGYHWFLGSVDPISRGETVIVEFPVPNDARYATRATVAAASAETFALELDPDWERVQQRAFIRISAYGLQVRVVRLSMPQQSDADHHRIGDDVHELIDISAGGIRFSGETDYEPDEDVICHFELPGSLCFVLPARIVRSPDQPSTIFEKPSVSVEFIGLDEMNRSQLLRWVYREQVRRHREEERAKQTESQPNESRR
jgi:c-di-GMP-binding flagellar brake protein YcgR